MEKDYKIHYLVMLEIQRLTGTNHDFSQSFSKLTDNEITAFIDKATINYPHQKIEALTDKLTAGFYSYLFVELPH
ncbi:hypothetical protein J7E50_17855 [Pedobacter sp. ISL-68]|uniref:hypothetical protein n=1 Tax=unclassified Pedobacter TaxID=2628915 RepID=UPI001BE887E8|nr:MULTISPECIES: hypothetical protein [unclassified Pedobacter]MBT2559789.1 hypothetical protein [Pedobacter sp. ISL-64]MBT2592094.1 hypothetical protein [Pedobacter sp. ISL-68]